MDENDNARVLEGQATETRRQWELSYGHRRDDWPDPLREPDDWPDPLREPDDWPDPLREPDEPAQDELDLLHSQVPGHRWNAWCCLTGEENYFAACFCGWRSTDAGDVSAMPGQVREHLDAVRQSRGGPPAAPDESGPGVGRGEIVDLHERARELPATATGAQMRLSRSVSHSADLPSASAEHADRLAAGLERGEWARTGTPAPSPETVRHKVQHARELRNAFVAAAAALAVLSRQPRGLPG